MSIKINHNTDEISPSNNVLSIIADGALTLPIGLPENRPSGSIGMVRFNTDDNTFEGYNSDSWIQLGSTTANPTGTDGNNLDRISINGINYNIPSGSISGGITITVLESNYGSDTPIVNSLGPVNPSDGNLWFNSYDSSLFFRYNDGADDSQWIGFVPDGNQIGPTDPIFTDDGNNVYYTGDHNVGIGTSTPLAKLHIRPAMNESSAVIIEGDVDIGSMGTTYTLTVNGETITSSDIRGKTAISNIRPSNALDIVTKLQGVRFNRYGSTKRNIGLLAQQVQNFLPEAVYENNEGFLGISYGNIVGVLIEAIKAQQIQLLDHQITINSLQERIERDS